MSIEFSCACGKAYRVGGDMAGVSVRCKACGRTLVIPDAGAYDLTGDDPAPPAAPPPIGRPPPPAPSLRPPAGMVGAYGTVASNPGRLRVEWAKYFSTHPFPIVLALFLLGAAAVVLGRGGPTPAAILAGAAVWSLLTECLRARQKFLAGNVNPGVVLSRRPDLVAVYADLSAGGGVRPAVKILPQPLGRMTGGPPEVGARVATAALYQGPLSSAGAWVDVYPEVVNCVTGDRAAIAGVVASIPGIEWRALDDLVARLPDRRPGLYTFWDGNRAGKSRNSATAFGEGVLKLTLPFIAVILTIGVLYGRPPGGRQASPLSVPQASSARPLPPVHTPVRPPVPAPEMQPAPSPALPPIGRAAGGSPLSPGNPANTSTPPARPSDESPFAAARRSAARAGRGLPPPAAPAAGELAQTRPAAPADVVDVFWGSTWYPATVLKREGNRAYIKYDGWGDASNEWVTPERIRARQTK